MRIERYGKTRYWAVLEPEDIPGKPLSEIILEDRI